MVFVYVFGKDCETFLGCLVRRRKVVSKLPSYFSRAIRLGTFGSK